MGEKNGKGKEREGGVGEREREGGKVRIKQMKGKRKGAKRR